MAWGNDFPPRQGRHFADGADVVDYLTEIPLPGRTLASPMFGAAGRTTEVALPSFVAGPENRLVAATVNRLLNRASTVSCGDNSNGIPHHYIPHVVALFGPSGVGKTHLARGLVRHWQKELGDDCADYTTAADFRRYFTESIDGNAVAEFRRHFRERKLLAIDDLHHLPSNDYLVQELRYTLDAYEEAGGIVVVTSVRPADMLGNLPPDLRSRLASGLILQLAPPGNAARVRIIRQASTALGHSLSDEAAHQLADGLRGNATELFGALFELLAMPPNNGASDAGRTNRLLAARATRRPSLPAIVRVVAKYSGIPQKQLKSGSRKQSIVFARGIVVYLTRELAGASYDEIGRALGGRDHTTIMHNYRKIDRDRQRNLAIQETLNDLRRILLTR